MSDQKGVGDRLGVLVGGEEGEGEVDDGEGEGVEEGGEDGVF